MCGIWGMYGDNMSSVSVDKFLQDAAATGTVRGAHSTGVFHVYWNNKTSEKLFANSAKEAVAGYEFTQSAAGRKILTTASNSLCVVGHNRYATGGGFGDEAAHPFTRGPVTLVHNGVVDAFPRFLQTFGLDATDEQIKVDSDGVAAALASVDDPLDVLKELHGAYALVWFDERTSSVYFAKNDERPLAFSRTKDGVAFASESGMLEWLMHRHSFKSLELGALKSGLLVRCAYDGKTFGQVDAKSFKTNGRSYGRGYGAYGGLMDYADYEVPWSGSAAVAGAQGNRVQTSQQPVSSRRTNASNHDYGQVMDAIWKHLKDTYDLAPNSTCNFSVTGLRPTKGDTRGHVELIMQASPFLTGRRYFAAMHSSGRIDRIPYIDSHLERYLDKHWEYVHTVEAKINAVVLAGRAAQDGWMAMTTDEIISGRHFTTFVQSEGLKCYEFADDNMQETKVGFDSDAVSAQYDKLYTRNTTDLVTDSVYLVTGVPKHVLRDVFKGNPEVLFKHVARTDPNMAVVQPIDNPSVTMLQPIHSLKKIM